MLIEGHPGHSPRGARLHASRKGAPIVVVARYQTKEIASLTWAMVTDAEAAIGDAIHLTNSASKGKRGGRTIPLNTTLREALMSLKSA